VRRMVSGIPTGKFRNRLVQMCTNQGLWVVAVNPAYTSKWGRTYWLYPLAAANVHRDGASRRSGSHWTTRPRPSGSAATTRAHRRPEDRRRGELWVRPFTEPRALRNPTVRNPTSQRHRAASDGQR
jgi:hypothetical protein